LLIGKEFHPFSLFPMYNSFPNYGYAFYLKNEHNEMVPFSKNFSPDKNAGYIAHTYASFFNYNGFKSGFGIESPEHLRLVGNELMDAILKDVNNLPFDTLKLYRRNYFIEKEKLTYKDDLIHERRIKP